MDRATAAGDTAAEFAVLAGAAGLDVDRTVGRALDAAYSQMGFASADLPDPVLSAQQGRDFPALVDYYVLRSIARNLAVQIDTTDGDQKQYASQAYKHASEELARVEAILNDRGYGTTQTFALGRVQLDFLEPDSSGGWSNG